MSLSGKTAIVTGSTSGIGLGIARKLAANGANILLNGFADASFVTTLREEISGMYKVKVSYSGADVSKADQVEAMVKQAASDLGGADILVNNAGIQFVAPVPDFPLEKWDAVIATNLSASFYAVRVALPIMRKSGWGRIINIASAHGLVASADKVAYVSAKHGLVGLTKVVALETAKDNITCNAICPGWVLTPLVQKQIDAIAAENKISNDEASNRLLGPKQPSMQFVTPEQIGGLAVFLCSDDAKQITGSAYSIDGGWVAE